MITKPLTENQQLIMNMLCDGKTVVECADTLFKSNQTVKNTLTKYIYPNLGARNKSHAVSIWTKYKCEEAHNNFIYPMP